jgi:hypothetical protein
MYAAARYIRKSISVNEQMSAAQTDLFARRY